MISQLQRHDIFKELTPRLMKKYGELEVARWFLAGERDRRSCLVFKHYLRRLCGRLGMKTSKGVTCAVAMVYEPRRLSVAENGV
jgi:hypothetical protein